jgi:hypothetical protein
VRFAIAGAVLLASSVLVRLLLGLGGLSAYSLYLIQHGFPVPLATALDFGHTPLIIAVALGLGAIGTVIGLFAAFRKGAKKSALIAIAIGLGVVASPLLLLLLASPFSRQ